MTTPGQSRESRAQRARLGGELRRLRMLAGLTGRAMARETGISQPTIVRVERGESLPSRPQVQAWARAAKVPADQRAALLALLEAASNEVATYRSIMAGGLAAVQRDIGEVEAGSGTIRNFQPGMVPGLLQTADYAMRVLELANISGAVDLAEAVAVRQQRQQALYAPGHRFEFIITEGALRRRMGSAAMLAAQLGQVASLATLESVELAVIPADAPMHTLVFGGFILYEDRADDEPPMVAIETAHAQLPVTEPADVKLYADQLARFRESALSGGEAVEFVRAVANATR